METFPMVNPKDSVNNRMRCDPQSSWIETGLRKIHKFHAYVSGAKTHPAMSDCGMARLLKAFIPALDVGQLQWEDWSWWNLSDTVPQRRRDWLEGSWWCFRRNRSPQSGNLRFRPPGCGSGRSEAESWFPGPLPITYSCGRCFCSTVISRFSNWVSRISKRWIYSLQFRV